MSLPVPVRFARVAASAVTLAVIATGLVTVAASPAGAVVPTLPVALPVDIEQMPPYQPQRFCDPVAKPGIIAFEKVLTSTYNGTAIVSTVRPCGSDTSEHYDGRAIDWGVDHRNDKQRAQGKAFLHWLLAADANGNAHAMLRRLGVMYVIWNKQIFGGWGDGWEPYSCSGATACHVDHMHLSFDWSGALKRTSFWTGKVRPPMAPPLFVLKNHTAVQSDVSARDEAPEPEYKAVAGGRYRFTVKHVYHYDGRRRHRADAECSTTDGTHWTRLAEGDKTRRTGLLDLWVNGHRGWRAVGTSTGGCSATHTYQRTITFPDRVPLQFFVNEPDRWQSYGDLAVTIQRVG